MVKQTHGGQPLLKFRNIAHRNHPVNTPGSKTEDRLSQLQAESDLDLLVRYKEAMSLFDVSELKSELEKHLGNKVDLISKDYLKPRIKKRILQGSVRIL